MRLHRARLFVRQKVARQNQTAPAAKKATLFQVAAVPDSEKSPASRKALFAQLSNYLDEQLDDSLCATLEEHLGGCEPCKAFLASLETTIQQLRTAPSGPLTKTSAAKIRRELLKKYPYPVRSNGRS